MTPTDHINKAIAALKQTTIAYPAWAKKNDPNYGNWGVAFNELNAALADLGTTPPPPPPTSDSTPPAVKITTPTHPAAGSYTSLSGTVKMAADASDNVGVARVEFYFGSTLLGTVTTAPYEISFDSGKWPNGQVSTLGARAYDTAGNKGEDLVYVQVVNAPAPGPGPTPPPPPPPPTNGIWPASYFTGPAGAHNLVPPKAGCFIGIWGNLSNNYDLVKRRQDAIGRKLDIIGLTYGIQPGGAKYWPDSDPFGHGHEDWIDANGSFVYATCAANASIDQILAGACDAVWHTLAQRAKAWGKPLWVRHFHEFNGPGWQPFYTTDATKFCNAWKRMIDIFRAESCTNVCHMWCPAGGWMNAGTKAFYPGDDYVDWVAQDGYCNDPHQWCNCRDTGVKDIRCEAYCTWYHPNSATDLCPGKPMFMGETGINSTVPGRSDWLRKALADYQAGKFPKTLNGISYFDSDVSAQEPGNNWLMDAAGADSAVPGFRDLCRDPNFNTRGLPLT